MHDNKNRSPGRPKTADQKQPTDELILLTASQLFLENSYQDVSMDDVAKACNVTKATVYYYYKTKSELYTETMIQLMYRIRKQILDLLSEDKAFRTRLENVAESYLSVAMELDVERFMHSAKNMLSNEQIKAIHKAEEYMYQGMEKAFQEAMDKGEIAAIDPTFAVHAYISLVQIGNYKKANGNTIFPTVKESAEQIVSFFWKAVTTK